MRILRKLFLMLIVLFMITVLMITGIFIPSKIFEFTDSTVNNEVFYQELGSAELTLVQNYNQLERMRLLTSEQVDYVKEYDGDTASAEDEIYTSVSQFFYIMCYNLGIAVPEIGVSKGAYRTLLYIDSNTKQSAVVWEYSVCVPEDAVLMVFMVDDITRKTIGIHIERLNEYDAHSVWNTQALTYALQQTFTITFEAEAAIWIENLTESQAFAEKHKDFTGYQEYTLILQDEDGIYYHFPMCMDSTNIAFNMICCNDWYEFHGAQEVINDG